MYNQGIDKALIIPSISPKLCVLPPKEDKVRAVFLNKTCPNDIRKVKEINCNICI